MKHSIPVLPFLRRSAVARLVPALALCALAFAAAFPASGASAGLLYSNDFTTRTSSDATPSGRWMEAAYVSGALVRSVSSISEAGREPYNISTDYQDAWTMKTGYCRSTVKFTVADTDGNDLLCHPPVDPSDEPHMFFKYRITPTSD